MAANVVFFAISKLLVMGSVNSKASDNEFGNLHSNNSLINLKKLGFKHIRI